VNYKIMNGAPHVPVNHKYFKKWHLELPDWKLNGE
jgi:hypothetical protein